jgi:hypothetical protein
LLLSCASVLERIRASLGDRKLEFLDALADDTEPVERCAKEVPHHRHREPISRQQEVE